MKKTNGSVLRFVALATTLLLDSNARAGAVTMTFEGLGDFEYVREFYNDGLSGNGRGPGPEYGVSFPGDTITSINDGPSGASFAGQPTPGTALSFQQSGAWMNVPLGFTNTLSFFYGNPNQDSTISVYSEINGAGQRLATLFLPRTGYESLAGGGYRFDMEYASVSFSGLAKSVDFLSMAHRGYVDDISLFVPSVPEAKTYVMFTAGLALLGVLSLRRTNISAIEFNA